MNDIPQRPLLSFASIIVICVTIVAVASAFALASWHPLGPLGPVFISTKETSATVQEMRRVSQLVVLKGKVAAFHRLTNSKKEWIVNLGTTEVTLFVPGNGFQYIVKLDGLKDDAFQHDVAAKRWVLRIPKPVLDTEMIACESDPAKMEVMTKVGWARFDGWSGQTMRDETKRQIRECVIKQAQESWIQEAAKDATRSALDEFIMKLIRKLPDDETFSIEFIDETPKNKPGP